MLLSPMLIAVGAGLMYSINPETSTGELIGFQILMGLGIGGCIQMTDTAVQVCITLHFSRMPTYRELQAEWADEEGMIPRAASSLSFIEYMGGAIGLA